MDTDQHFEVALADSDEMDLVPRFVYLCRLCKKEHLEPRECAGASEMVDLLLHSILGIKVASGGREAPRMVSFHLCGNGQVGVSDLKGLRMPDSERGKDGGA